MQTFPAITLTALPPGEALPGARASHCATQASELRTRLVGFDALRVLAAFGIVWFHLRMAPDRVLGYPGLPIFILITVILTVVHFRPQPVGRFTRSRATRLLLPWVFWSVIFALMAVQIRGADTALSKLFQWRTVLGGTSEHLWYLPYAFALCMLTYAAESYRHRRSAAGTPCNAAMPIIAGIVMGTGAMVACCYLDWRGVRLGFPIDQWRFAMPAAFFGWAIAHCLMLAKPAKSLVVVCAITLFVAAGAWLAFRSADGWVYAVAVIAVAVASCLRHPLLKYLAALTPLTLGIFLLHPLVFLVLVHLRTYPSLADLPLSPVLIFALALALTWVLRLFRIGRAVV